jgi:hypothetical protein
MTQSHDPSHETPTVLTPARRAAEAQARPESIAPGRNLGTGRPGTLVVRPEGPLEAAAIGARADSALRQLGARIAAQVSGQDVLLQELRLALRSLQTALMAEGGAAASAAILATANEIVEWCHAVQVELHDEASRAVDGQQAIDLLALASEALQGAFGSVPDAPVRLSGATSHALWGKPAEAGALLRTALQLVAARSPDAKGLHIELGDGEDGPEVAVFANGGAAAEPDAERIEAFREACEACAARVVPDQATAGIAGLRLRFPLAARGPLLPTG